MKNIKKVKEDLKKIVNLEINADWETFHNKIIQYLELNNLQPSELLTEEITGHYLNALNTPEWRMNDFLSNYTNSFEGLEEYSNNYYIN